MRYSYTFPVSVPRFIHIGAPAPKAACVSGGLSQLPYLSIHEPSQDIENITMHMHGCAK